ncbi:MAG: hypothetical protein U0R50_02855 [Gaiellales bacterium]
MGGAGVHVPRVIVEVSVRAFSENLSEWLDHASAGDTVVVTESGRTKVQ